MNPDPCPLPARMVTTELVMLSGLAANGFTDWFTLGSTMASPAGAMALASMARPLVTIFRNSGLAASSSAEAAKASTRESKNPSGTSSGRLLYPSVTTCMTTLSAMVENTDHSVLT